MKKAKRKFHKAYTKSKPLYATVRKSKAQLDSETKATEHLRVLNPKKP